MARRQDMGRVRWPGTRQHFLLQHSKINRAKRGQGGLKVDNDLTPVHILLVEDNPHDVEITRRALEKGQVTNRLTVAQDGQQALDILAENRDLPSLILLDLNLPRVDGIEVLKVIKADPALRHIPVIVLTTS